MEPEVAPRKPQYRSIRKDGSLNIEPVRGIDFTDLYHDLLKLNWVQFTLVFATVYLLVNVIFGFVFFTINPIQFEGFREPNGLAHYLECFFFSVQTFGTIGYGKISPIGVLANSVVTIECFFGIILVAMVTGLIFARFAKPSAKIIFSEFAVIRKFEGVRFLLFRIANRRQNYITDAQVKVSLAIQNLKTGYREFTELKLERDQSPLFSLSWTIAHELDATSPLASLSRDELFARDGELIVTFSGNDTTLSQLVFAKYSYVVDEIVEDHDFENVIHRNAAGRVSLKLERFHQIVPHAGD